jgi:hypothetical protein
MWGLWLDANAEQEEEEEEEEENKKTVLFLYNVIFRQWAHEAQPSSRPEK